ncbi:2-succinyl-5-enolpyruvyl-6-hydroxy-3-cyclohexene-1-carboxylic-acid synthase [Secundilactobacillus paracollinoides]|uniref:2-succinyl-5-enolpyruvyl-6-hydroxy-3-cyclohexene-1-carboxylate synthase n=2 Tax=Secundilactobacillus paracollinoides TaxID=240427 RepID=A0A1B2IVK5_9LACO|nr:2-succinyl-5-enolpyruvyl-6-hydroxy-3-cyclohexene-1-carboxylic-acid synthase [Secundilactobacillus paracollinoides]ANZ60263.1 hypothetical protein AYR61_02105 [Secundilactobacillus paracollinoides]ANZ66094.1 hypothetical protein AYR63_02310 [Secundilactobacillus paracollinoides]KRL79075.1 menaquinone biosynthesis protein MenD [Secundilactobacillus paracollinoides DSM 15502 = JCM 11969]
MTNEGLTTYVQTIIDAIAAQGVKQIVISPGSRSTPVALLLMHNAGHDQFSLYVDVDERSAGFFALGMTKTTHEPTLLICTSGTAAANYYPAVIEAQLTHQPLIVLTTDRPAELTNIGAPQAIDQDQLYGNHVKTFVQLPLPAADDTTLRYVSFNVQRTIMAAQATARGPVHLNLPLRKPLMPDLAPVNEPHPKTLTAPVTQAVLTAAALSQLTARLSGKRVLILAGPAESKDELAGVLALAHKGRWPILADPLSQLRQTDDDLLITGSDILFDGAITLGDAQPDVVLRFGATPVSATVIQWLQTFTGQVILVDPNQALADHSLSTQIQLTVTPAILCQALLPQVLPAPARYCQIWQALEAAYRQSVRAIQATEARIPVIMSNKLQDSAIFVSNSMPIRDVDHFYLPNNGHNRIYCNRGANGIDGVVSSALGMAAVSGTPNNYLLIGDLAFFHDMNGLMMAKRHALKVTIIVVNNNGGGIFSFLPQAAAKDYFEPLFGTPQDLDVATVSKLYGAQYERATTAEDLQSYLNETPTGLRIIEVPSDREENTQQHRQLSDALHKVMEDVLENYNTNKSN